MNSNSDSIEMALWRLSKALGVILPAGGTIADKINFMAYRGFEYVDEKIFGPRRMIQINKYLYETWYSALDYEGSIRYFKDHDTVFKPMACSSVRKGNLYGRNFDWFYDNNAEYVVHTDHSGGRYSTLGISAGVPDEAPRSIIPFFLTDGINEHGLVCNMNVVPNDYGNTVSVPTGEVEERVNGLMLARCILDNFKTADEAIERIQSHVSVWFPKYLHSMGYELHYMIADANKTYILEFVENEAVVIESTQMTNFHLQGVTFNQDGTVYTPHSQDIDHDAIKTNGITPHGSGLERWNIIVNAYDDIQNKDDVRALMGELMYTKLYTEENPEDIWYTELAERDLTCASNLDDFSEAISKARSLYQHRSRESSDTWQTTHSAVYDMTKKTMSLISQEDSERVYSFEI